MITELNSKKKYSHLVVKILVCFLLLLQLFPPLWIQDVTSSRHFLIALFDISALSLIAVRVFKKKLTISNPFKFKPIFVFLLLIIWMLISMIWAINRIESIATWNRWMLVLLTAILMGAILENNPKIFQILVYCTILIAIVNVLTCIIGYYYFDLHISQRRNLMLNGGYGNKNIFAVCLVMKLPFLYYAVLRYKRLWKIVSLLLISTICFCLVIISTRSTFISLFLQLMILLGYAIFEKLKFNAINKYVLYIIIIILCAVVGLFGGNKFIEYNYNKYTSHNTRNNYTITARVQTIEQGNSKGRLLIWRNTLETIKKNPILGCGIGNHKLNIMSVEAKKKMNFVVSDHAHNDFLEMQSELGIMGEILYVLMYISMILIGLKLIYDRKTKMQYRLITLCSLLLLVTYMVDALFNFPNERATPQIYLALSFALLSFVFFKSKQQERNLKSPKLILSCLLVVVISLLYVETCHFISSIVQHQRIICFNSKNSNKIPPSYWVNITPWLPNIDESTKPIAINNASMFALEQDYRTAINIILNDNSNPFYGLKEYRLASYYAHLGMKDSSNYWADKCIAMKPLCYDPVSVKIGNMKQKEDIASQIKLLKNYIAKEQKEERAWLTLLNIYISQGDYIRAEQTYQQFFIYNDKSELFSCKKSEIDALKHTKKKIIKDN
ncbi:MAG: O-antigen ligase family protein [Bacteroidales bacterium]